MKVQATTTGQALQVLREAISGVAVRSDIERKVLNRAGYSKAAEAIGSMMHFVWRLYRCCESLNKENVMLREAMELKEVEWQIVLMRSSRAAKPHLN